MTTLPQKIRKFFREAGKLTFFEWVQKRDKIRFLEKSLDKFHANYSDSHLLTADQARQAFTSCYNIARSQQELLKKKK